MIVRRSVVRLAAALALVAGMQVYAAHAGTGTAGAGRTTLPEPFDAASIDRRAPACADFFAYSSGVYRREHPIPAAYAEYGYIEALEDRTRTIVRDIVERAQREPGPPGSDAQKIGALYGTCMDTAAIDAAGLRPLQPELARIAAVRRADLAAEFAHLQLLGVAAGLGINATQDARHSSVTIAELDQSGIGLPERDYYLRPDAASAHVRARYRAYVAGLLTLAGDRAPAAEADAVVALETRLARISTPIAALRDPYATYHPMSAAAAARLAPHARLPAYFAAAGLAGDVRVNVPEPAFLRGLDALVASVPMTTWRTYLRWRLLDTYAATLPARFEHEEFAFHGTVLEGTTTQQPRWKRCVERTDALLGEAVGRAYVARAFPPPDRAAALALAARIRSAYRAEIAGLTWMTATTKRTALAKLDAMGLKVGYPPVWLDYAGYDVRPSDAFAANVARGTVFARRTELARIGKPVDRNLWFMTPQTVNAYNDVTRNEIVLPAAQLQRPFYDATFDDAANLGGTGAGTIGHEMTHGFDDEGHQYDATGSLRNWWSPADARAFASRAQCVIREFDGIAAAGTVHYQGKIVAGEAIADLGGVVIGYRALERSLAHAPRVAIDGFTPEQRYFLSYAQSWSEEIRPQAARAAALGDPHPLPRDRVNATLANVPEWYAAFDCPKPRRPVCVVW